MQGRNQVYHEWISSLSAVGMADRIRVRGVSRSMWHFSWQSWHESVDLAGSRRKKETDELMLRHSGEADNPML
jgi:hypothetical protein